MIDRMTRWCRAGVLLLAIGVAACGSSPNPPNNPGGGSTGESIRGTERLGWTQSASSAAELASLRFAAYVDNNRVALNDVNCGASGGGFECSSRMPSMTPGTHTIELVSFVNDGVESARSAPLRVTLSGVVAPGGLSGETRGATGTTADGIRLALTVVADRVESPTSHAI